MVPSEQEFWAKANDATPFSQLTYLLSLITSINSDENLQSGFHTIARNEAASNQPEFTLLDHIL